MTVKIGASDSNSGTTGLLCCSICQEQRTLGYSHFSEVELKQHKHIVCCNECAKGFFSDSIPMCPVCRASLKDNEVTIIHKTRKRVRDTEPETEQILRRFRVTKTNKTFQEMFRSEEGSAAQALHALQETYRVEHPFQEVSAAQVLCGIQRSDTN